MDRRLLGLALLAVVGCGDPPEPPPSGEWIGLLSGEWSLAPGDEKYVCARKTLSHTIDIARFRPAASDGTHHTLLTVAEERAPDGAGDCSAYDNGQVALFATGYGTEDLELPEGVAVRVLAGTQLLLNVHLLNTTSEALDGSTGTDVFLLDAADVEQTAEVILAGKVTGLEVVPGDSVQTASCSFAGASTVHAVMPHMHERGSHFSLTAKRAAGDVTLLDEPFIMGEQYYRVADPPLAMAEGDQLEVACSYQNPSATTYEFGPTADDEMCYGIFVRYPTLGTAAICTK